MTSRLSLLLVVFITACGPTASSLDPTLEPVVLAPRGTQPSDAGVVMDAGRALDAGSFDSGVSFDAGVSDAGVQADDVGTISISVEPTVVRLSASFRTFSAMPSCGERTVGSCRVRTCTGRGTSSVESAGTVTLSARGQQAVAVMDSNGNYGATLPFALTAGEVVTVAADGDVAPAFSVSVSTPAQTRIASPVCAPFVECAGIERQTAPTFQWLPVSGSGFSATFVWEDFRGNHLASCTAPSSAGTATLDATAWNSIPPTGLFMLMASIDARTTSRVAGWELNTSITAAETMVVIE